MTTIVNPKEKEELLTKAAVKGRSLWDDARIRLLRNKAAVTSMIILGILVVLAILGQLGVWVHDYDTIYRDRVSQPPTWENLHLLGTDAQGRDLLARTRAHELKRQELDRTEQLKGGEIEGGAGVGAARIELADLKERIKKLEAIASGVEL